MFKKSYSTLNIHSRKLLSLQKFDVLDWRKQEQILLEPIEHIRPVSNTQYRMMVPTFNHWLQVPKEKLDRIQEITDIAVTYATVLDDLQDDSAFRYGIPSAQRVFGLGLTVNSIGHALLVITKKLKELDHPSTLEILLNRMTDLHLGQGSDLYWQENNLCPSEKIYIEMIRKKNGSFYAFPVELLQLFSGHKNDDIYSNIALNIGQYLTFVDDYYNMFQPKALQKLAGDKQATDRIPCSDITEGKITLPVIHALQFPDVASELIDILNQRTSDPRLMNRFVSLLKKHGSDEYLKDAMKRTDADIRMKIDQLGGNPLLTALMDELDS